MLKECNLLYKSIYIDLILNVYESGELKPISFNDKGDYICYIDFTNGNDGYHSVLKTVDMTRECVQYLHLMIDMMCMQDSMYLPREEALYYEELRGRLKGLDIRNRYINKGIKND